LQLLHDVVIALTDRGLGAAQEYEMKISGMTGLSQNELGQPWRVKIVQALAARLRELTARGKGLRDHSSKSY
jgi:hypothetical protein